MKKFLSFLLATVMVVGTLVPVLTLFVSAEGNDGADPVAIYDFPELVITEMHTNAGYRDYVYSDLSRSANEYFRFLASTMVQPSDVRYTPVVHPGAGNSANGYYTLEEDWLTGNMVFKPAIGGALQNKTYYRRYVGGDENEVIEFFEVYNSGSEPVNLYDYKFVRDWNSYVDGEGCTYIDIKANVSSAAHGEYFQKAGTITAFDPNVTYYTKSNDETYVPVSNNSGAPDPNTAYYYLTEEGYFVDNPSEQEGAWLNPGQVAVLWNYNERAWLWHMTEELFKAYFITNFPSVYGVGAYGDGFNWDDVLFLAIDGNSKATNRYHVKDQPGSDLDEGTSRTYGLARDTAVTTSDLDTAREEKWTSWVVSPFSNGTNYVSSFAKQNTVIGTTSVLDGYYVFDAIIGEYIPVSKSGGTADANGNAVAGYEYYKPSGYALQIGANRRGAAFMYGIDASVSVKEGKVIAYDNTALTPGVLENHQAASLPNYSKPETIKPPKIVITEIVPDNGDSDAYEYVEVLNTSGKPLNVFDYSFVATANSHKIPYNDQYFNKINPLIPGEYGTILAAYGGTDPNIAYEEIAPTNVPYYNGWLQPGETAILWAFNSASYAENATFERFRAHYGLDETVKVYAMDADDSSVTGRSKRQSLIDTGSIFYGLVSNEKLIWGNDMYVSEPVLLPIVYDSGSKDSGRFGIPMTECESFVHCSELKVTCEVVSLGIDYGYQYVWGNFQNYVSKCGAYLRTTVQLDGQGGAYFAYTGSVLTDAWKASPGKLIAEQKTDFACNAESNRYVVYMQDFNSDGAIEGYDAVAQKLGLAGVSGKTVVDATWENFSNNGNHFLELRDGKLYVNNKSNSIIYMQLMSHNVLSLLDDQSFTIEYSMTYDSGSSNSNGYSGILYNYDAVNHTYGAPIVRLSGYGNNAVCLDGSQLTNVDNGNWNSNKLADTSKSMIVRIDVNRQTGVIVTVNNVVVSSTDASALSNWNEFLTETIGTDLVLATSSNISVAYDYITVYTDRNEIGAGDNMYGNGFAITEYYAPDGENAAYKAIEVTNTSDIPMNLYDYMIVSASEKTAKGTARAWNNAIKFKSGCPVSVYDTQYQYLKHISNPSSCVVQPGETVVVWMMSNIASHADEKGKVSLAVDDFRNYYAGLGNEQLTAKNARGNYVVPVIMAYDRSESTNAIAYGLARQTHCYTTKLFTGVFSSIMDLQNSDELSLGYLTKENYNTIASLEFLHIGEIVETDSHDDVTKVVNIYCHESVLNGLTEVNVESISASVSSSVSGSSVTFKATINAAYFNCAVELFGEENVSYGILISGADMVSKVEKMRPYLFEAAGVSYKNDNQGLRISSSSTRKTITSNAYAVDAGYYSISYSAMPYISIETQAFGTITKYAEAAYSQNVKQIAATAMMKYLTTAEKEEAVAANPGVTYYEIEVGKWSIYTREQIDRLNVLCK